MNEWGYLSECKVGMIKNFKDLLTKKISNSIIFWQPLVTSWISFNGDPVIARNIFYSFFIAFCAEKKETRTNLFRLPEIMEKYKI